MGQGVARTFAKAGFDTIIRSSRAAELKDLPAGVRALAKLPETPPDLVLELVPEEIKTKQAVYLEVEAAYPGADVIIATGTSVGVGVGFNPPKFLRHGDVVRVAISGLGELNNPVEEI